MFIRAYLRASTADQDANRARESLEQFIAGHGHKIAASYVENASGATAERSELRRLLADAKQGDILLLESIDRLSRLPRKEWTKLRAEIEGRDLRVVALDLPTSHKALAESDGDDFTTQMLDAVNGMMLDMLAAIARKDYEQRRERQAQGIANAKNRGVYKGRPVDQEKHDKIRQLLAKGCSVRETARLAGAAPSTVQRVKQEAG
ncbi:recombinase family protein [Wenzhouxiangella limi]|uniref:Recombinase family protein n=1 Tax=Wenzhouxiangella limi TaxID=2707351 RepID=A0A845V036_9GAMM|nr:recombinase family protein [Wenzhouxiangella limi]NDY96977.1 recombinase family protein [Wenzhouxiangella limi]